jgi:quinol monooxygenase YgiN
MNSEPKPVTVIAILKARPGKETVVKQALLALIPITRRESGCLNYDLHQDTEDPSKFIFHENWASKSQLDAHLARPHLQEIDAQADELFAEEPMLIFAEKIG